MAKSPTPYSVNTDCEKYNAKLVQKRTDIIHSAAMKLGKCGPVKYYPFFGSFQNLELGLIASQYYSR
jgi:pre-mRNA-splicing helicase BRR2